MTISGRLSSRRPTATRRFTRRRLLGTGVALSGSAAFLAACGGGSKNNVAANVRPATAATQAPATSASAAAAGATATPARAAAGSPAAAAAAGSPASAAAAVTAAGLKTGGTLQLATIIANPPLDTVTNTTYATAQLVSYSYSRLFRFDSSHDPNVTLSRTPVPDLVGSYEVNDPVTYTMKVRDNAVFQPPLSRPANSADVVASFQRFRTEVKNVNRGVFDPIIDSITAPDDKTVLFKLKQPYAPFLNQLANPQYVFITSAEAATGKIDPSQQVIGTGPWIFQSSTATGITFKRNPNYFIKGLPLADGVQINYIPDTATQQAQFQAGKLDVLGVGGPDVGAMQKAVPKADVINYVGIGVYFLYFSDVMNDSVFKDPRMRQAASLSVDRAAYLDLTANGKGAWDNFVSAGLGRWWLDPNGKEIGAQAQWFKHDPQRAKQLVAAAGQANTQLSYVYTNNGYGDLFNQAADAVRGMEADAGFHLNVVTVDYLKDYISPNGIFFKGAPAGSMVYATTSPFTDPDGYLSGLLTPTGNRNASLVNDPALTAAVRAQQVELDPDKRLQLVYQAQRMADDLMYYAPIGHGSTFTFVQPWVQNYLVADDYSTGVESAPYLSVNNH